jgi:hypothetical protein
VTSTGSVAWFERLERIASVAAPTTVATALLFYFGYVATYSRFAYFGIDLAVLDMSMPETLLRGAEAIYVPLAGMLLLGFAAATAHRGARWGAARLDRRGRQVLAGAVAVLGAAAVVRGVIGIVVPVVSRDEFPGTTPIAFGFGPPLIGYAVWIVRQPVRGRWRVRPHESGAVVALVAVMLLGLFWATNSFASAYGRGIASTVAVTIRYERPAALLDTKERLYTTLPDVTETVLPVEEGQEFRYRYRGLYLLAEGGGNLYLVSPEGGGIAGTIVVPFGDTVRVQFSAG